jgi:hypothetical protein
MRSIFIVAILGLASAGCLFGQGASPSTVVQGRASREFACPVERVVVEPLSGSSFRATACGTVATYTCMGGNLGNPYDAICTKEASGPAPSATR